MDRNEALERYSAGLEELDHVRDEVARVGFVRNFETVGSRRTGEGCP